MAIPEYTRRAIRKYNASRDQIHLRPSMEEGAEIRQAAEEAGESLQGYILKACRKRIEEEKK